MISTTFEYLVRVGLAAAGLVTLGVLGTALVAAVRRRSAAIAEAVRRHPAGRGRVLLVVALLASTSGGAVLALSVATLTSSPASAVVRHRVPAPPQVTPTLPTERPTRPSFTVPDGVPL